MSSRHSYITCLTSSIVHTRAQAGRSAFVVINGTKGLHDRRSRPQRHKTKPKECRLLNAEVIHLFIFSPSFVPHHKAPISRLNTGTIKLSWYVLLPLTGRTPSVIRFAFDSQRSVETQNPVRVIRGFKLKSQYAPREGYRYDGLYTVEKVR